MTPYEISRLIRDRLEKRNVFKWYVSPYQDLRIYSILGISRKFGTVEILREITCMERRDPEVQNEDQKRIRRVEEN